MKSVSRQIALLVLGLAWLSPAYVAAQEQCEPWYSVPHYALDGNSTGKVRNRSYSLTATIEPTAAEMVVTNYTTHSAAIGFWGYYLAEPQPPVVTATDGDHDERVEVEWEIVDDRTGPPVTGDKVTLYRNGYVLTTLPITQREYQDFNVFPGEVYNYAVTTANEMGESHRDLDVGFLNPNGVVIGAVKTPNGNAVQDVKVVLTPNLGRSALFDGDAYVYFPELLSGLGADYTIEGWFRSRESQRQTLFAAVDSATVDHFALIELTAEGKLRWQHSGTAGEEGTSVISVEGYVEDGDWHHFAAVFDSVANQPSTMVLYVDGDVVASAQAGAAIGADEKVQIAMGKLGPKEHSRYLDGRLDDWRVWDVPRSRAEIRSDRDRTLAGDEEGLHAYWKFDEVRGEIVFDLTANDNDGRLCRVERSDFIAPVFVGALTDELGRYSIRGIYYASGTEFTVTPYKETPVGRSLRFDGVDDYVDFPHRRLDFTQGYTLEGWFKSPGGEGDMTLFTGVNAATGDPQVRVELLDDGRLKCAHMSNELASTVLFDHDYWHHFAVAYDADEEGVAFYIDGEAVGTAVNADPIAGMSAFALARQSPQTAGRFYAGLLDEIRVWDYGRTAEQIGGTMRQTLGGDETGVAAYWRLNEGDGDLVTDSSSGGRSGSIQGGVAWADDIPLSETFVHSFDAESRQVILNPSNTSVDRVDFTDISQIGVGGYVKYEATPCFIEGAEVLVNGESLTPPIYTDENGKFIAEFEPGATGQILTIRYRDHEFVPPLVELPRITVPRTGLYFNDREKREVSGKVAGGACEFPITPSQGQIEVTFAAIGGCAEFTAVPDEQTGMFTIRDVPPLIYQMTVDHPDPEIDAFFTGDTLSLENEDREVSFVYRSAPQVAITGFPENACGLRVMEMEQSYPLDIEVYEEYTAYLDVNGVQTAVVNSCPVNSGTLTILDAIGDRSPVEGTFENGGATYAIIAGYPNILDGGDHPYQKNIQVAVVDDLERTATAEEWTIVSGHRPRNTAFATTTPEIPVLILRDPPGDESYSFLSQGTTMEQSVSFGMNRGSGVEAYAAVHLGPDVEIEAGFFISKTTAIDVTLDFTSEFSMGISQSNASEQTWSFSTTESFETTGDGDVYVGGAMNIVYGVTDVLEIDAQTCEPYVWQDMVLVPDGFATTYIYSESQILDNVIPNLRAIGDDVSADRWESFVAMNQGLKDRATFSRNISFDAGAVFEYEETSEVTESQTYEFELEVEQAFAMDVGLTVDGMGATGGQRVSSQMTVGNSRTSSTTSSNTVGFVLADDDGGDTFTLNVKNDPVYGTPVFETVSGFSQCPWEENTVPLDGAQLGVSPALEIDVPPDEVAVFTLDIGNVSEADADREYQLRVINQSNPDGAVIAVNGVVLEEALSFFVPAGEQVQATMTVARGPEAYAYEDLQVQLVPPCEYESWLGGDDLQQADTVSVAVHYLEPCSECNVAVPENGWLVTAADQTSELMVTLDGYDREDDNLEHVELQYRRGSGDWFVAASIPRTELADDYAIVPWSIDPSIVIDGTYQLRGRAVCSGDMVPGISPVVAGLIDRNPPQILGAGEPADGILHPDDQIAIRFNEAVECGEIDVGAQHIQLTNTVSGQPLDFTHTCGGDEIVIEPGLQNKFIENQTLRVEVGPVEDLHGNVQTLPLEWELYVNRNPLEWSGLDIENVVIYVDETFSTTRLLNNTGGSQRSYELAGEPDWKEVDESERLVPAWLEVSPKEGTIAPGAAQTVSFRVDGPTVGAGTYRKTIYASGMQGDEPRRVDVRVLCHPPVWEVNPIDFQHSMTITATLTTEGELSDDPYDVVGVFVGDELRGVAPVQHMPILEEQADMHPYEVFLTVYSNKTGGENLTFRVWDASECRELGMVLEDYAFEANASYGTPTSPMTISATSQIISEIALLPGWTWFSLNLMGTDMSADAVLGIAGYDPNDQLKSQNRFAMVVPEVGWMGDLPQQPLQCGPMYMLKLAQGRTLELIGYAVDVEQTAIPVQSGWNWIGYLPQQSMDVQRALESLPSVTGDIIKSQFEYAQFVEGMGWLGSLRFLNPKLGYQLYSQFPGELAYPFYEAPAAKVHTPSVDRIASGAVGWAVDPLAYRHNMTLIGVVEGGDVRLEADDVLAAFVGDECRGVAQPIYVPELEQSLVFLMIYGDEQEGEGIRFRLFDVSEKQGQFIPTEVEFLANDMLGTVLEPHRLETRERRLGDPGFVPDSYLLGQSYPNPFNPATRIGYGLPREGEVDLAVYNLLGQRVVSLMSGLQPAGYWQVMWDGRDEDGHSVRSGLYFFAMEAGDFRAVRKVLLVK